MIYNINTEKAYIGSTKRNLKRRLLEHKSELKYKRHKNPHLQHAWDLYGKECFNFLLVENCNIDELYIRESFYINSIDTEYRYNLQAVGRLAPMSIEVREKIRKGNCGKTLSQDTKVKIAVALKGNKNGLNHKVTEEHKKAISVKNSGNKVWLGKRHSEKTIEKMKQAWTKRKENGHKSTNPKDT